MYMKEFQCPHKHWTDYLNELMLNLLWMKCQIISCMHGTYKPHGRAQFFFLFFSFFMYAHKGINTYLYWWAKVERYIGSKQMKNAYHLQHWMHIYLIIRHGLFMTRSLFNVSWSMRIRTWWWFTCHNLQSTFSKCLAFSKRKRKC